MTKRVLIAFLLVAATTLSLQAWGPAPDVSGHWVGRVSQEPSGTQFDFEITLVQNGKHVTGTSRISTLDGAEYYGVLSLEGDLKGKTLKYKELASLESHALPGTFWCLKRGSLKLSDVEGEAQLEGDWSAPQCSPGHLRVRREPSGPHDSHE
ncbi:MAG TPA: hypothetical protein VGS22_07085 [Thermoanaerobaculia bacterium]|jgi:hypothetical protein|nr:hypothetical protein [Thermoanaerobaculia bacterium]